MLQHSHEGVVFEPVNAAVLTTSWDDGTPEDLRIGQLLARYGYRGTFYATTGPSGRRTIPDDGLRELVDLGHEIGNHGRTHRLFPSLSTAELKSEIAWGAEEVSRYSDNSFIVAPPKGRWTTSIARVLRDEGHLIRGAPIVAIRESAGCITPSFQFFPHSRVRIVSHLVRRHTLPNYSYCAAWIRSRDLRSRLERAITVAGCQKAVLHIWGHSRDIERYGLWTEFERLLNLAACTELEAMTNGELATALGFRPGLKVSSS